MLNQHGQCQKGVGVQYGCGGGVCVAGLPVRPLSSDGKRPLRGAQKNQGLSTGDLAPFQDEEALIAEWVKRMGDADGSRRLVGGQCIVQ